MRTIPLLPTIARQVQEIGGVSDIRRYRIEQRKFGFSYLRRELVRAYYELRLVPQQIVCLARRQGTLLQVQNSAMQVVLSQTSYEPSMCRVGRRH